MSDDRTIPTFSDRLWSEEVGMADPGANFNAPPVLSYSFGGRTLVSDVNTTLYNQVPQIPALLDVNFATRQAQRAAAIAALSNESIVTAGSISASQIQRADGLIGLDGLVPQPDAAVATRQGQRSQLAVLLSSENITSNGTATTRQAQKTVTSLAVNGVSPPVAGAVSARQAQYAAAVVAVDGVQPGSDAPIAIGGEITTFKIENTATSPVANAPFSLGHVFAPVHLPAAGAGISLHLPTNSAIAAQLTVKALHGDGSVRHAIICGVLPSLAGSGSQTISLRRAAAAPGQAGVGVPASLPSATIVIAGATYTASCAGAPYDTWFSGPTASDYIFNMPFIGAGGPHPLLTAQFSIRAFSTGQVRVDFVLEHCKAYGSTADITYDVTLTANGSTVYSKTGLVHTPAARWKKTFWMGGAPTLHIRHDTAYLIASKQVPNYDQSVTIPESVLAGWATDLVGGKFEPMQFGRLTPAMGTTGGRPDIGIMPDTHAATVLSMDRRAKAIALATADIGGSWPMCRRDDTSSPGRGLPLSVVNFPYVSLLGNPADCINPATGKNEKLPALTTVTQGTPDSSHQPGLFYLPYLLTGDFCYLEGLHFWCTFNHYQDNPAYRDYAKANVRSDQVRGQGWSLRTLAEAAAITPDDHPLKSTFRTWYDNNMAYFNARYVDATDNQLGIITNGYAFGYPINGAASTGVAPWMDDFFTQALGHGAELLDHAGARRMLAWKAKFQIGRLLDPAVCIQDACSYALGVRSSATAPLFGTLAECFAFTVAGTTAQYACNSPQRLATYNQGLLPGDLTGYPASETGYPANFQPGLAYAVDSGYPGGLTAWATFQARPTKPNFGLGAQFAIVPRSAQTSKAPLLDLSVKTNHRQSAAGALNITATPSTASTRQAQHGAAAGTVASSASTTTQQAQHSALAGTDANQTNGTTRQGQRVQATLTQAASGAVTTGQRQSANLASGSAPTSTVSYTVSTADIPNPERGFYVHLLHTGDFSTGNLNVYKAQNMRLVLYQAYLTSYKTAALDSTFLTAFQSHLDAIRSAGMKTILRFAYTSTDTADATLTRIQGHLDQLAPYLSANDDVILGMQAGFVGRWGEFQGSDNFGSDSWPPNLSSANKAARKAVIDKCLAVMPAHRFVQTRQPWIKMDGYGSTPLNAGTAFANTAQARLGHFNDCFLSGSTDSGTYTTDQAGEEAFLAADTVYVPMGGETCTYNEPRSSGTTAISEMARFHWTFCNSGYQDLVIQSWKDSGDYATIAKRLGYRLALTTGTYPTAGTRGAPISISFGIANSGFAAPVSGRTAYLVLRNTATNAETRLSLATDPRTWLAGATTTVSESVLLPTGMAAGSYALFLALPDADASIAAQPGYAIQLANTGTWESGTGYNALNHTMTVS